MNFKEYIDKLEEQGIFNSITNFLRPKQENTSGPRNGDNIKIFNLHKGNGTYIVADIDEGKIRIEKDGSVHIQFDNNMTFKIANNIQQANLKPNGNRSWKMDRYLE